MALEAQEQINLHKVIDALNSKITSETHSNMTKEQEYYVIGLADALEIVKEISEERYVIGRTYYVLIPDKLYGVNVEPMKLYRINHKKRTSYCFTRHLTGNEVTPDLVLNSEGSLKLRVFNTREEAEKNKNIFLWRR